MSARFVTVNLGTIEVARIFHVAMILSSLRFQHHERRLIGASKCCHAKRQTGIQRIFLILLDSRLRPAMDVSIAGRYQETTYSF